MWCFIDESWHRGQKKEVGVLAAAVGPRQDFEELGRFLFRIRRKYYGEANARDLRSELKGMDHRQRRVFGMLRLQWHGSDQYSVRKLRTKK